MNDSSVNWKIVFALLGVGFLSVFAAGFISPDAEIKKLCARTLLEGGKGIGFAALALLRPSDVSRVFTNGQRATDKPALKEGSAVA